MFQIPFTAVEFALKRCQEYISIQTHEDIDRQDSIAIWDHQWDQFLTWYYLAVHDNFLLIECRTTSIVVCKYLTSQFVQHSGRITAMVALLCT